MRLISLIAVLLVVSGCYDSGMHFDGPPREGPVDTGDTDVVDTETEDADTDSDEPPDTDTGTDTVTDTPVDTDTSHQPNPSVYPQCAAQAGYCTPFAFSPCAPGFMPYGNDEKLDCPGHCCVPADTGYSCNAVIPANCITPETENDCWQPSILPFECPPDRYCAMWVCK